MRRFYSAVSYVRALFRSNNVVILSEHWLHENRLNRLNEISDSISYCAKSSKYASAENYGTARGQGGVAILWKSDLSGISEIKSFYMIVYAVFVFNQLMVPSFSYMVFTYLPEVAQRISALALMI